jgi:peptidoglycan hydrolase-like protein with peptidoglycan-binding domain
MSSRLRAFAVASCTALLVAGVATSASAGGASAFTLHPAYGLQGSTLTLTGADFSGETGVTIHRAVAKNFKLVNSGKITVVVPAGVTSGPVAVTGATTLNGPTFTVQQKATATSTLSRNLVTYTHSLVVTGVLTEANSGHPIAGQSAVLQHRAAGSKAWHHAKGTKKRLSGPHGGVSWRMAPSSDGSYRVVFLKTRTFTAATSGGHSYKVAPLLRLNHLRTAPVLSDSQLTGTIRPWLTGTVYLQKLVNGVWHHAGKTSAFNGRFSFTISPTTLGLRSYRASRHSDSLHAHTLTPTLHLQVVNRELSIGDSGPDVRALQKRLHKLHYYVGSKSHFYGDDLLHAVTAFEKVQGFTPNGEVTTQVWKRLNHPKRIHLKHKNAGTYEVEVNIGKQVLLMAKDGHITSILDTSTAGGYLYKNSEGGTSRAITPTGHFSVQYKLTGTRVSKLGTLYYPSYFTNTGYAIHGEGNGNDGGEVPPYPNSHGCVRITDDAVLHFFSTPYLAVGTSVWIYH